MAKRKRGVASHFWPHKMHVKMLIWLVQSQCYSIGRKKLIWGCQGSRLKYFCLFYVISKIDFFGYYSVFEKLGGTIQVENIKWFIYTSFNV